MASDLIEKMQPLFLLGYIALGLIQLVAVYAGLVDWLELNWFFAIIGASFVAYIPIVGTVLGILGAMNAWDWPFIMAAGLMLGPILIAVIFTISFLFIEKVFSK